MFDKAKGSKQDGHQSNDPGRVRDNVAMESASSFIPGKSGTIGPGINITGDITGSENLSIEGTVQGRVDLGDHEVVIGKTGRLNADIVAKSVRVDGNVQGDIVGNEKVVITRTGNVKGNIVAPRLILEDGAIFKGSVDMTPPRAEKGKSNPGADMNATASPRNDLLKAAPGLTTNAHANPVAVDQAKKEPGFAAKGG